VGFRKMSEGVIDRRRHRLEEDRAARVGGRRLGQCQRRGHGCSGVRRWCGGGVVLHSPPILPRLERRLLMLESTGG
jgi:hypothetical protein